MFSVLPQWSGRRPTGFVIGGGTAALLTVVAVTYCNVVAGVYVFLIVVVFAAVFFDGGLNNLTPLSAQALPG